MRKIAVLLAFLGLFIFPGLTLAASNPPQLDGLFGLGDPNNQISYYDVNSVWKYYCFKSDCYDITTDKLAFVKDIQPEINDLQNKVNDLQGQINQLQQPVVSSPIVSGGGSSNAYTEQQLIEKFGITQSVLGGGNKLIFPINVSNDSSGITFSCIVDGSNFDIIFNGQTIIQHCQADHPELANDTGSSTLRSWVYIPINGLKPYTSYSYQVIYHEDGKENSIFNKTFTTSY